MATTPIKRPTQSKRRSRRLNPEAVIEDVAITPNSSRIPMATPNLISQDALNLLTNNVWDETSPVWTPGAFLEAYPTEIKTGENMYTRCGYRTLLCCSSASRYR